MSAAARQQAQTDYWGDAYLPGRRVLRRFFDDIKTEFFVTGLVLINMLGLLIDLAVTDAGCNIYMNVTTIQDCLDKYEERTFIVEWTNAFQYMELGFLILFTVEIMLRVYTYSFTYFLDVLNSLDAAIVIGLLILQILLFTVLSTGGGSFNFLRIVRLVRLVRLFVVMNKVQKAQRAYKKAKYLKLGSPVERVMELLQEMRGRIEDQDDVADISWIMHLISSDKLYTIDIKAAGGGNLSSEMTAFLEENLGMKKDIDLEGEDVDDSSLAAAVGLKRQETKMVGGSDSPAAKELARLDDVCMLPEMQQYVSDLPGKKHSKLHEWDIDVFDLVEKSQGAHLVVAVHQLLDDYGLISKFRLSKYRLLVFLRRIQDGYKADNPYHNSVHALDVTLNTNYFIRQKLVDDMITPLDRLAVIFASTIHDFQHPGVNNQFLSATRHEFAVTYNDQSVLESHHVAAAWKLLLTDECNFLKGLSKEQYLEFRDCVIQLVLATDMKFHFEHYTKFKTKVSSDTFVQGCDREDVKFLLAVLMHTADISNPAKPLNLCLQWTELVMEEFFRQGDREAQLGMPVSPFYDREKTSVAQCQMGFINVLVKPLFAEFTGLLGAPATSDCFGALEENLKGWETHGNELFSKKGVLSLRPDEGPNAEKGRRRGSTDGANKSDS